MGEKTHTPGRWFAIPCEHSFEICTGPKWRYEERLATIVYWEPKRVHMPDRAEAEANARLIASAPALLEAAFKARHRLLKEGFLPEDPTVTALNAAISAAKGEAQ